jgi:pimeloyl-ACP methyl ester carboxylesterase
MSRHHAHESSVRITVHGETYDVGIERGGSRDPQAPCIVLLNGSLFNYYQWNLFLKKGLIPHGYQYLRYDYGGTGRSLKPFTEWNAYHLADELAQLLSAMKLSRVHLYGISKGTIVGQVFAARYPSQVASLSGYGWFHFQYSRMQSMISFFSRRLEKFNYLKDTPATPLRWREFSTLWHDILHHVLFHSKQTIPAPLLAIALWYFKRRAFSLLAPTPPRVMYEWFAYALRMLAQAGDEFAPYYEPLQRVPMHLQHGVRDRTLPYQMALELRERLPHVTLTSFDSSYNHVSPMIWPSHAAAVCADYRRFLESL